MKIQEIWENSDKAQRILLFFTIAFCFLTKVLTWFALTHLEMKEANPGTLTYIVPYGIVPGLVLNFLTVALVFLLVWIIWVGFSERSIIVFAAFTFIFLRFFWMTAVDFAHDLAMISFHSHLFQPFVNQFHPTILAAISTIPYFGAKIRKEDSDTIF